MKIKKISAILLLSIILTGWVQAQSISFGMNVHPRVSIPLGEKADNYTMSVGAGAEGIISLTALPFLSLGLEAGYNYLPLNIENEEGSEQTPETILSLIDYGLGLKAAIPFGERLSLFAQATASAYSLIMTGNLTGTATGFKYKAGGGANLLLSKNLALQAGAWYDSYPGLYDGLTVSLGLTTRFSGPGSYLLPKNDFTANQPLFLPTGGSIEFLNTKIPPIFPVLYKYYFSNPVGTVSVMNIGDKPVEDVEIRLSLSQYMDNPELSGKIDTLIPGEAREVNLYIFFNYSVLSITEGAKLAGELKADYNLNGQQASDIATVVIDTYDRNAMMWDDDKKIASFITARDEEIQRYARNIASMVRGNSLSGFSTAFQQGIAYLTAMNQSGCTYVVDPTSSYSELSSNASAIDAIQFPRQTLEFKAGDCDDLTTTYTTLLESVGVETAFITVPGHIYSAFKLDMTRSEASSTFSHPENLIFGEGDQIWVPIETTALTSGFLKAWELGARQWREHDANGSARLYPTKEAWNHYAPVAFKVSDSKLESPAEDEFAAAFKEELEAYVDQEISIRGNIYQARLENNPNHPRTLNSLGVLYARYDRKEEATSYFEQAAATERPYAPALVNLGNMAFLQEDYYGAGSYYQKALNIQNESSGALLGLARVSHALNDFEGAKSKYNELESLSPDLAKRFAYLGEESASASRASDVILIGSTVAWDNEE
ncbi:MAG: hypothetical protein JEY99_04365 [Spirochaetales bacterium]|nr:hypothetical protein [Spirochaetales bacterium]